MVAQACNLSTQETKEFCAILDYVAKKKKKNQPTYTGRERGGEEKREKERRRGEEGSLTLVLESLKNVYSPSDMELTTVQRMMMPPKSNLGSKECELRLARSTAKGCLQVS